MDGKTAVSRRNFEFGDRREHSVDGTRRTVVKRGLIGLVALGCVVATSTGCSQVVQGRATAAEQGSVTPSVSRPDVPAGELFDPCSLPLASLDPKGALELKDSLTPGIPDTSGVCVWTSSDYSLSVTMSVTEFLIFSDPKSIPDLEDVRSEKVGAFTFDVFRIRSTLDDDGKSQSCNAQTATSGGNVSLSVFEIDFEPTEPIDACATTEDILRSLEPYLPAPK
ncbi:hypothetical protein CH275_11230 [Rhodococcus sp. 06-235-1A]|uniref:DUF3558 family protein n=1 Tax=Rhodococcus sp. 06-235-1A TaxID=2022508 RepID=UPI000B9BCA1D|nr:DUF3558 family protein [Rhodococcus sp. 06-235-1A]OZD04966.1 hypothetical protein CH275_11230 [Rhodococcus sp. 06-235-1A]